MIIHLLKVREAYKSADMLSDRGDEIPLSA